MPTTRVGEAQGEDVLARAMAEFVLLVKVTGTLGTAESVVGIEERFDLVAFVSVTDLAGNSDTFDPVLGFSADGGVEVDLPRFLFAII